MPTMNNVYVRFERGRDNVVGPTYGPYDYVQITYSLVRAGTNDDEHELAHFINDDWQLLDQERDDTVFSDLAISWCSQADYLRPLTRATF